MRDIYKIGNAQTAGSCYFQSNYFSVGNRNRNCVFAVLADGSIDHINGRRCAVLAVEACVQKFYSRPEEGVTGFFDYIAEYILKEIRRFIYIGKVPALSLSLLFIKDKELFYYTVGNNRLFIYDGRNYKILEERSGQAGFGRRMTAGMFSNGAWEALKEKEVISYLEKKQHPFDKAQQMLKGIMEKNSKETGNATIILVEGAL
ncbi:MAG: hypothetical protein HFH68_14970 [Lachnospiraceae bacterium]|nr:hypothetical protein [Lachnospiraceae bacterium]